MGYLPRHIDLKINLKTGLYEATENGNTYQLTFTQVNDLKIYCSFSHGSLIPTIESWYNELSRFSRKAVKRIGDENDNVEFYPDDI